MTPDAIATLHERLLALRDDLRRRLAADTLDAGLLHLLASVEVVLAALGRDASAALKPLRARNRFSATPNHRPTPFDSWRATTRPLPLIYSAPLSSLIPDLEKCTEFPEGPGAQSRQ